MTDSVVAVFLLGISELAYVENSSWQLSAIPDL